MNHKSQVEKNVCLLATYRTCFPERIIRFNRVNNSLAISPTIRLIFNNHKIFTQHLQSFVIIQKYIEQLSKHFEILHAELLPPGNAFHRELMTFWVRVGKFKLRRASEMTPFPRARQC